MLLVPALLQNHPIQRHAEVGGKPTTWTPLKTVMVQHALQLSQQVTAQLGCSDRAVSGGALCAQGLLPHMLQQPNAQQHALLAQASSG